MAASLRVAIVAPGEMGYAVGARLRVRGATVTTCLSGRGERSARRARAAGMVEVLDDEALVRAADIFLSIVPPGAAVATAERIATALARTGASLLYVDCNAIAPATVEVVAHAVTLAGADSRMRRSSEGRRGTASRVRASTRRARRQLRSKGSASMAWTCA